MIVTLLILGNKQMFLLYLKSVFFDLRILLPNNDSRQNMQLKCLNTLSFKYHSRIMLKNVFRNNSKSYKMFFLTQVFSLVRFLIIHS